VVRTTPIGYRHVLTNSKDEATIVPFEQEACFVRKSFDLVKSRSHSPADALRIVTDLGMRSKAGNKINQYTFGKMLRNTVYIGKTRSKNMTFKGLHDPLITEEDFDLVQLILKGEKRKNAVHSRIREGFPLRNFLICSECGVPLTGAPSMSKTKKLYDYCNCPRCHAVKSIATWKAAEQFREVLGRLRVQKSFMTNFNGIFEQEWTARTHDTPEIGRGLETELEDACAKHDDLLENRNDPRIAPHFDRRYLKYVGVIENVQARIAENRMERATFEQLRSFSESLNVDIPKGWELGTIHQQRRVQSILFPDGLKYHPEKGILNLDNECLFNQLQRFLSGNSLMVRPERFELPT
jgi:hypothetical protein